MPLANVPLLAALPFAVMLLCIAFAPTILKHHWERYYPAISLMLGAISTGYYLAFRGDITPLVESAKQYLAFISLVGSLFVITGGIHLRVKGTGKPWESCVFLLFGVVLANLIGTTGAAMLLIRPWIRLNRDRFTGTHLAFFIFLVCSIGGGLLPMGPPLFLGYIVGVPFWWGVQHCWLPWLITVAALLLTFYLLDHFHSSRAAARDRSAAPLDHWQLDGALNVAFLVLVLASVIFLPAGWRECLLITASVISYFTTQKSIRRANAFTFAPFREVVWLFAGIFATMVPALEYVAEHAPALGIRTDAQFFWLSGFLSAVLDNAPTYMTFLATAFGLRGLSPSHPPDMAVFIATQSHSLVAISLGSTFFGALTYIGNGPNFMVKSIAEHARVATPGFLAYAFRYAMPVLLPIFVLIAFVFLRG